MISKLNITRLAIFVFFLQFLSYEVHSQKLNEQLDVKEKIDVFLKKSVENGYAGSVLIAKKGEVILSKGYGWADRKMKILNDSETIFNIGSVTKQFTATAILKLVETGQIELDDKILKYFPHAPSDKEDITIHQLLTHTSGISPRTGGFRYNMASKEQFLNEFFTSELIYEPSTKHTYANANYILLAAIIEEVSHQDFETFLRENFWDPLGMNHTGYKSIYHNSDQFAHGYEFLMTNGKWVDWGITQDHLPHTTDHWYSIGKGDIYSTVNDLFIWHQALENNKVLSAELKQLMETPFAPESDEELSFYGYGWAIVKSKNGSKIVTHNGSNGVYFADFIRNMDEDIVIIVLSNILLNRESGFVGWEIASMITDSCYTPDPVPKNKYELVFKFIQSNNPDHVGQLTKFFNTETGDSINDRAILNRIGFKLVSENLDPEWGITLLKLNVTIFPNDGNLWDTLGESYYLLGNKDNAISSFEKALELSGKSSCSWCENSKHRLNELLKE